MAKIDAIAKLFVDLVEQLASVEATKRLETGQFGGSYVDEELLLNWKTKARHLIVLACGKNSEHYERFVQGEKSLMMKTNFQELKELKAVFMAAKEDYDGGYLQTVRTIVQAELFSSEIDQASELLASGYHLAAAVIAGVVLETSLRQLCIQRGISIGVMDRMNAELAREGVYNTIV